VRFFLVLLAVPAELSGGRYPAPAWAILALGGAVVAGAVLSLALRSRHARRASTSTSPPTSTRASASRSERGDQR
jgi:hypothetical protein